MLIYITSTVRYTYEVPITYKSMHLLNLPASMNCHPQIWKLEAHFQSALFFHIPWSWHCSFRSAKHEVQHHTAKFGLEGSYRLWTGESGSWSPSCEDEYHVSFRFPSLPVTAKYMQLHHVGKSWPYSHVSSSQFCMFILERVITAMDRTQSWGKIPTTSMFHLRINCSHADILLQLHEVHWRPVISC